jgi:phospholipase/carboxylesterase
MLKTEFIPAAVKDSRCLLVVLHGLGDSAAGYRQFPGELNLPWLNYLLVNAPAPYYSGYAWYDFTADDSAGVERSRRLLADLLDRQREEGFRTEETVLFGFSQGCVMTIEVGFRYPHRFAGLVGVSGYVHHPPRLLVELSPVARQQRMLFTHGTFDPLVPCLGARAQVSLLREAGLSVEWKEFPKAHSFAGEPEFAEIRKFISAGYPNAEC